MRTSFAGPTRVWSLTTDADWQGLAAHYAGTGDAPWKQILAVARRAGAVTVVDEANYADIDWRSEYSSFWSLRFAPSEPLTRRLHFFGDAIAEEALHRIPQDVDYLGYTVLRPVTWGRIGRTVLAPPPEIRAAVSAEGALASVTDTVHLFGRTLAVTGVPFCQQDAEYLRCAHAAAWVCHYTAALQGLVGRVSTAELAAASPAILQEERQLPSGGMTLRQLQAVFSSCGQPALLYPFDQLPDVNGVPTATPPAPGQPAATWDVRMFSIICRYLNSRFPVLIATSNHAFVLVGWFRDGNEIRFIACDDQVGPYEVIDSPFTDRRAPWMQMMVPLPPKVLLSAEMAEHHTHRMVQSLSAAPLDAFTALAQRLAGGELALRTALRRGSAVLEEQESKGRDDASVRQLRLAALPRWVWHVEVIDRAARKAGVPSVVAEAIWDSTSHDREPRPVAVCLPYMTQTWDPYRDFSGVPVPNDPGPWVPRI